MEIYKNKPLPVEVYTHGGGTDVILRRDIRQEERPATEGQPAETVWVCEEVQGRFDETTAALVEADFDAWWARCALWRRPVPDRPTSIVERVADIELLLAAMIGGAV